MPITVGLIVPESDGVTRYCIVVWCGWHGQEMKQIAFGARIMETTGLSLSLIALCISVLIFFRFRYVNEQHWRDNKLMQISVLSSKLCVLN